MLIIETIARKVTRSGVTEHFYKRNAPPIPDKETISTFILLEFSPGDAHNRPLDFFCGGRKVR